jgi:nicotinate-nucleotide pyrophosphorylase (carboxylating)
MTMRSLRAGSRGRGAGGAGAFARDKNPALPANSERRLVRLALAEDLGRGDLTTEALIPPGRPGRAAFVAREPLVVAGMEAAAEVFRVLDPKARIRVLCPDGCAARRGQQLAEVSGRLRAILSGERTALNFLRHLSGIATTTRRFARALAGTGCRLLDTRKTTPGMRVLEKAAVRAGGGLNHREGLFDAVLIKNNHIDAVGGIENAVRRARRRLRPGTPIEVEVRTLAELEEALSCRVDRVLLDNFSLSLLRRAVRRCAGRVQTEASGNIRLVNARAYARTGVDYISVGALTHSAPAADISLWVDVG